MASQQVKKGCLQKQVGWALLAAIGIISIAFGFLLGPEYRAIRIRVGLHLSCVDAAIAPILYGGEGVDISCSDEVNRAWELYQSELVACFKKDPGVDRSFFYCVEESDTDIFIQRYLTDNRDIP